MIEPREITESFRLERVLKSSRSAIVFRAADPGSRKVVAIKLIPPGSPDRLESAQTRFLAAMEAVAVLGPAGFPPLLDCGFSPDGSAFMVMEFVEGTPLEALGDADPRRVLALIGGVADGLERLALRKVAHGNLRPDNLLSVGTGDGERVAILGFGTAAFQGFPSGGAQPAAPFTAPELLAGTGCEPDWRSDVHSLALTACALLGAEVTQADVAGLAVALPVAVRSRLADPVVLHAILEQALRRDPEARPSSPGEFRQGIEFALEGVPGYEAATEVAAAAPAVAAEEVADGSDNVRTGPVPIDRRSEMPSLSPPIEEAALVEPEELLHAVEVPTPAPEHQPAAVQEPATHTPAEIAKPTPPAAKPTKGSRRTLALGIGAAALVLLAAAATLVVLQGRRAAPQQRGATAPTTTPRRPATVPPPAAQPAALTQLQTAEAAIALGELVGARQALDSITQDQLERLSAADRERYASLRAAYDTRLAQTLTRALAGALASGNMKALAETVRGISPEDEASFARNDDLLAALEEARRALNVQSLMLKAQRDGDWVGVIQQSGVLSSLVPRYAQASDLRERAATALEREAEALAAKGNYEVALGRLESVRRSWPQRAGIADRIERVKADRATDQQLAAVLATAGQAERDKVPEKGLAALAAVSPPPRWQERVREEHDRLAKQLQQLDAAPPTVALVPGRKLEYKKNEPATIALRITDDHGIKSAKLFARLEGTVQYVELPLRPGADGQYDAEISPVFHKNGTVEFYAVATDFSDHVTQLGSAADPLKLKRKKWFLFGG